MVTHPKPLITPSKANNSQLDRLIGLAMLIVATTVFLYYTIWTLLMVWLPSLCSSLARWTNNDTIAIRRPRPPSTRLLPASRLGDPHTCDFDTTGLGCCRVVFECGDDTE